MHRATIDNPIFHDTKSAGGVIQLRREHIGEIGKWVEGEYWHLSRCFSGRSIFFGSGIDPFVDPHERFLVLRDAAVILLFDYTDGASWHAESPWGYCPGIMHFPEIEFTSEAILIGRFRTPIPRDCLHQFFQLGLGRSQDGFLTHWRPEAGHDNEYSRRLLRGSALLGTQECEQ
jgi:hypothetical protein